MESEAIAIIKKAKKEKRILIVALIVVVVGLLVVAWFGWGKSFMTDSKTTKLGFEDIGELATQSVTATTVNVETKERKILDWSIPFTKSKIIYSYDAIIKAGIDFCDVQWRLGETESDEKNIYVSIPEVKILSSSLDYDSFKLYHEEDNIFTPITVDEHNDSLKSLAATAEEDAIANGLFDKALENAKVLLTAFIGQVYDLEEYTIVYAE